MTKPIDSVRIVLFSKENPDYFLVITEADDPDNWKLPGGKFEIADKGVESPAEAATRELMEEVGLNPESVGLRSVVMLTNDDGVSARHIFTGIAHPEAIKPSVEIAKSEWFTTAILPEGKNRAHILSAAASARQ